MSVAPERETAVNAAAEPETASPSWFARLPRYVEELGRLANSSLARRLFLLALAQVMLIGLSATAIGLATRPSHHPGQVPSLVRQSAIEIAALPPDRWPALLSRFANERQLELTIIDGVGAVVYTQVTPPLGLRTPPPNDHHWLDSPYIHHPPRHVLAIPLDAHGTRLLGRGMPPPSLLVTILLTLVAGGVVIAAGALVTAAWLIRPIERLSRAAKSFGQGDFQSRVGDARPDEIGQLAQSFDEMAERVESSIRRERELLANVSHELRTPLARIRVAMDLAAESDGESARTTIADIASDLSELEGLIDDILVALRLESRGLEASMPINSLHEIGAHEIARRAAERFSTRSPARVVETELAAEGALVLVDPMLFRRVLDNLLDNAHKYSPDPATTIRLHVSTHDETVVFAVEDHGIGIEASELSRIFTPFYRVERSRSRGTGGVGLGLTLVRRIVEAHHGEVSVESELNGGTVVRVAVPAS